MRGVALNGGTLRQFRRAQGLTQESLADFVGCDIKTIRNAEKGRNLDAATVRRIGEAVGLPLETIILQEDDALRTAADNVQLVRDWQTSWNNGDVEALIRFYDIDAAVVIPGTGDVLARGAIRGADAIRRHLVASIEAFQTEKLTPDRYRLDAVGDFVFVRGTISAVVRATGRRFTVAAFREFEFRDGKIYRHVIIVDTSPIRRCLSDKTSPSPLQHSLRGSSR